MASEETPTFDPAPSLVVDRILAARDTAVLEALLLDQGGDVVDYAQAYAALSELIDDAKTVRDRVEAEGVKAQKRLDAKVVAVNGIGTFELKTKTETSGFHRDDCVAAAVRLLTDERPVDPETGEVIDADPRYGQWILGRFNEAFRAEPRTKALRALGIDPEEYHDVWNRKGTGWRFDAVDKLHKAGGHGEESR